MELKYWVGLKMIGNLQHFLTANKHEGKTESTESDLREFLAETIFLT